MTGQHRQGRDSSRKGLSHDLEKCGKVESGGGGSPFDPQRYQEHPDTPSSSSWSFSTSSLHSNHGNARPTPGGDAATHYREERGLLKFVRQHSHTAPGCESGFSSQEEFSLQATKKTLDFEAESRHNSLHDKNPGNDVNSRHCQQPTTALGTQDLLNKVQAYLGQCQSPAPATGGKTSSGLANSGTSATVEFATPEHVRKIRLTEQEVTQCVRVDSVENLSSPRSSEGDKRERAKAEVRGGAGVSVGKEEVEKPDTPLTTQRLRPIRQKTKNAVVSNSRLTPGSFQILFL